MATYTKDVFCGQMEISISRADGVYSLSARMAKFGGCSAYDFIGDEVARSLNSGETPSGLIERLKGYKCKKGEHGCIVAVAECIGDFVKRED